MIHKMTESEEILADIIWNHEPIGSGTLVKICADELQWKKSTTYTMLKKVIDKGIFTNEDSKVFSILSKEEYYAKQSVQFVEEIFSGSLPKFFTAFISGKKISKKQAEELKKLIDEYGEDK